MTLGLRLDYDYRKLDMTSGAEGNGTIPYHFGMSMGHMQFATTSRPMLHLTVR